MSDTGPWDVVVDSNEDAQSPFVTAAVESHRDVSSVTVESLPAADIELGGIGFERKTPTDFLSSMTGDRLSKQLDALDERYDVAYILIDGTLYDLYSVASSERLYQAAVAAIASYTARDGSGVEAVIPTGTTNELVELAVALTAKHHSNSSHAFVPSVPTGTDEPTTKFIYRCIDGVGPTVADRLYEKYTSVEELLERGTIDELSSLKGIGDVKAERIRNTFRDTNE